jgi:hypothetical protein
MQRLTHTRAACVVGCRWINAAPPSWLTPSMVPSNFTNTVEAAACDESVALVVPQLRAAAKQLLQQLKPGALQVNPLCTAGTPNLGNVQGPRGTHKCLV